MEHVDVIIIGSGPAGVHAAYPLVEAGLKVTMIDGGYEGPAILDEPCGNFEDVRRTRTDQYRLFLGEDLSSIPVSGLQGGLGGGMVSGNRGYVTAGTEVLLPLQTENALVIIQSLAKGGLAAGWGAACAYLTRSELLDMGLPADLMQVHYSAVTKRIGISGPSDHEGVQPPLALDHHAQALEQRYHQKKAWFDHEGMRVFQPHSAVLTQDRGNRKAYTFGDMDYYADPNGSVYRPQFSIEELKAHPHFRYIGSHVVDRIDENGDTVVVAASHIINHKRGMQEHYHARKVICAAGAIGTARILLRSFGIVGRELPFIAKSHALLACLQPSTLGTTGPKERLSLCQLLITLDQACAQIYSYRSLLLFRLLSSVPLPSPETLGLLSLLTPALVIADVRFPSNAETGSTLSLRKESDGHDSVRIRINRNEKLSRAQRVILRRLRRGLRRLGLVTLRSLSFPEGSTSHYAGTIPVTENPHELLLSVNSDGKLHQGKNIFVADASVFRSLPSKPHTLTIMANANRIGSNVALSLNKS